MAIQFISDIHCGMFQIFIWLLSTIFESRIVRISEVVRYLNLLLQVINLYFERFNIEEHPDCSYDFLQINDGSSASANPIGKYCGSNPPANITSTHDTLYIWFFSDISVNGGGFKILWNARDPGELDICYIQVYYKEFCVCTTTRMWISIRLWWASEWILF